MPRVIKRSEINPAIGTPVARPARYSVLKTPPANAAAFVSMPWLK
jgi:hypothetical protein